VTDALPVVESVAEVSRGIFGSVWKSWRKWLRPGTHHQRLLPVNMFDRSREGCHSKNASSIMSIFAAFSTLLIIAAQSIPIAQSNAEPFLFGSNIKRRAKNFSSSVLEFLCFDLTQISGCCTLKWT
jgi:hypothetical protein